MWNRAEVWVRILYIVDVFFLLLLNLFSFNSIIAWYIQGPRSSFQSAGADPPLNFRSEVGEGGGGGGGCGVVDFKNGLTGADSIFFNTVATHQSLFLII